MDLSHLSWLDEQGNSHTTQPLICLWLSYHVEGSIYETRVFSKDTAYLGRVALTTSVQIMNILWSRPTVVSCLGATTRLRDAPPSTNREAECLTVSQMATENQPDHHNCQAESETFKTTRHPRSPIQEMYFLFPLVVDAWVIHSPTRMRHPFLKELLSHSSCHSVPLAVSVLTRLRVPGPLSPLLRSLDESVSGVIFVTANAT